MYIGIDEEARLLWESCRLTALFESSEAIIASSGGHHVTRVLVEFFWDITNTFHFPWGEMMVTLIDFSLITGLEFSSVALPFDNEISVFSPEVEELLGPIVVRAHAEVESTQFSAKGIRHSTLAAAFEDDATTREQRLRIFVFILLSGTFSPNKGSRVLLYYLPAVRDLHLIGTYDWASMAYADFMWFYEYFPSVAPARPPPRRFPVSASWGSHRAGMSTVYVRDQIKSAGAIEFVPPRNPSIFSSEAAEVLPISISSTMLASDPSQLDQVH
ncbi:protein MAINTENANCE OF MERISTEMS-like [Chenopodium quinoa]|uniref:protein MAINTENANCE OF MERISTEMS-like n=1 Tax=Chenopodium quinoa TaxID=63459 RepID=UPI000B796D99|nr:protein MAINTENANCE OF MERISTEMS-like [Chenopodium quinoa]